MAPFSLMSVGANLLVKSFSLFSSASVVRCSCVAPAIKSFSTATRGPPKRPLTAYMTFVKDMQPTVSKQNPSIKSVDVMRKIAQQWKMLTTEQKQPFQVASLEAKEQYKLALEKFKAQLTPAESAAFAEEKRQRVAKRKAIRKKKELNNLGKPKRPRSTFNIFMAEHFVEAKGTTTQAKLKSLRDDWNRLSDTQKQMYIQLAEDDKVRYKNEIKSWEEHMMEIGREDLLRRKTKSALKAKAKTKTIATKNRKKTSKVTVIKAKAPKKKKDASGKAVYF
ncbi:transcription factor A, mitochondrial [Danio rerio]|uniref:Transcription factor A, mitochondrial n=1 Tax=Danio rerio TaxID=7955 RepID=Q08BL2_DANRE|nr:transcription factor A, mitochondrial [Danio rerio]AAI24668.1 Zgc:153358 [Danio rerio]AAI65544.1 Zgc:153358 protein [Danio rerio]|eukprot:NP_001070857.1 transcription factor A, mitochondrial [Danio rerio]